MKINFLAKILSFCKQFLKVKEEQPVQKNSPSHITRSVDRAGCIEEERQASPDVEAVGRDVEPTSVGLAHADQTKLPDHGLEDAPRGAGLPDDPTKQAAPSCDSG